MNLSIIYYFAYSFALFLIPWALYSLIFNKTQRRSIYTNRDWFYFVKFIFSYWAVRNFQRKCSRSVTAKTLKTLENTKEINSDKYTDSQFIYGVDQNGNSLSLRFVVQFGFISEIFLCLRVAGDTYTYSVPHVKLFSISSWQWKNKDLCLEILEPFKRFRLSFNGLLMKSGQEEHVQFNFMWTSGGTPKFYPQDTPTAPLADALASEYWRSGDWITQIGDERGYEQFGCLRGLIKGDSFPDELEICLSSCRTRFWGTAERLTIKRSFHLLLVSRNGTLFSIWAKVIRNGCSQLRYGNALLKNGDVHPIQSTDLRIQFMGQNRSLPPVCTLHIKVDGKEYKCTLHTKPTDSLRAQYEDLRGYELINAPAFCTIDTLLGDALIEFWYCNQGSEAKKPEPIVRELSCQNLPSAFVVNLEKPQARLVRLTGGKGSSLAWMTSMGFKVPGGFVVTVNAFNHQLNTDFNLKKAIEILDDICCGRTKGNLEHACNETVKLFQGCKMLQNIEEAILEELIGKEGVRWAVRSSGVGEDSEALSQAGQNETFLGCSTSSEVLDAIRKCWASLFTYQSVKYRHQHGIEVKSEIAVVVQKMVPSEVSGVLFTYHPTTSNPAEMVITANYGLGESVVSGKADPDTIIIRRCQNVLEIVSKNVGLKNRVIKMEVNGGGTVEVLPNYAEMKLSLTDEQIMNLAKCGLKLEKKFGAPLDIEWAYHEGELYLLQSRPITTLKAWSDYELEHEFDIATFTDSIYTVANTGEVFPGAQSTLGLSSVLPAIDLGLQHGLNLTIDRFKLKSTSIFRHFVFLDVINSIHKNPTEKVNLTAHILDLAIFGHPVFNDRIHLASIERWGIKSGFDLAVETLRVMFLAWNNQKTLKKVKKATQDLDITINDRDTIPEIYSKIDSALLKLPTEVFQCHCNTSGTSVFYQIITMTVLAEKNTEFNVNHYNDIAQILSSCEDVISAEVPTLLENIAKTLVRHQKFQEFSKLDPNDALQWLPANCPEASQLFNEFLVRHGHRNFAEFDIMSENWGMNPQYVIKMIQAHSPNAQQKIKKPRESIDEIIANLTSPTSDVTRKILKFLMKRCRRAVGAREQSKSEAIRAVNKVRHAYLELSRQMALAGLLPDPQLIFHLTHQEILLIIQRDPQAPLAITRALRRQRLHKQWNKMKFPEISYGVPQPNKPALPTVATGGKIKCNGTPVCSGVITARACVITTLDEIDQLQDGDILITYCTDIGWSPYFPILSGVVTELGGLVSHGAVVAREYGLPCIVGVPDATKLFKTGDTVLLSGKDGTIQTI